MVEKYSKLAVTLLALAVPGAEFAAANNALVAIVEEVDAPSTGLRVMDYIAEGTIIRLRRGETLTISFLRSCSIEVIAGGTARIGHKRSTVSADATIRRRFVECGIAGILLTPRQAGQSAGIVFRKPPTFQGAQPAEFTIYSTAPVFVLPSPAEEIFIERRDWSGQAIHRITASAGRIDLLDTKIRLVPGAIYSATTTLGARTFKVSPFAKETERLLLRRLISF